MNITAKTLQLGIIGYPVRHSFSPVMHNFIAESTGRDYVYTAFEVSPEGLADAVRGIRALGLRGVNVTAPHKIAVMEYLDEIDPRARELGSVNTIVNRSGRLIGFNTDSDGFYMALAKNGIELRDAEILVLGCGGVVKPTVTRIIRERPKSITILNRTKEKVTALRQELLDNTGFEIQTEPDALDFDIVLNTTSAGMEPQLEALPTDAIDGLEGLDFITSATAVVDMIYNPPRTRFLEEARARGARIMNGLDMLIYQGIIANELFWGDKLPEDMAQRIRSGVFGV